MIAGIAITLSASAQPEIESWELNTTAHAADYDYYPGPPPSTTNVQMTDSSDVKSVCYNSTDVYIRSNGLGNYTMGPWSNPNVPTSQGYTFKITREPIQETGMNTAVPFGGSVGLATNGVVFFGYGDGKTYSQSQDDNVGNGDGNWDTDAWVAEGTTMDATGNGHPTGGGKYHYHANPIQLYSETNSGHSAIIGYAFDGFPIYGPFGYSDGNDPSSTVIRMESSYVLRNISVRTILPDGSTSTPAGPVVSGTFPLGTYVQDYEYISNSGTLDEFNGRFCKTPEYPDGIYAYFLSTDAAGTPAFPYILAGEYYGVLSAQDANSAGSASEPAGLDCYDGTNSNSINEVQSPLELNIFPNPANNTVNLSTVTIPEEISIIALDGKVIKVWNPTTLNSQLDVSDYDNGVYFVRIVSNNITTTERLLVSK